MKPIPVFLAAALFICVFLPAQAGPTPYPDAKDTAAWPGKGPIRVFGYMSDNRASFWNRRAADQGAIVFVGDSLTGSWKLDAMRTAFSDFKVANRGIGGDGTRGVLFRFKEDVLDLDPRAVVVCIGTNDLSAHASPAVIAENIGLLLDQARAHDPAVPVVLCTVPPRANPKSPLRDPRVLTDLNSLLTKLVEGRDGVVLFDLFSALANSEGMPEPAYFQADLIHLSPAGYQRWAELITPVLAGLPGKQ